jgi:hypothetical protein
MVLKPQIRMVKGRQYNPESIPDIYAFLSGNVQPPSDISNIQPAEISKTAGGLLGLEARWKNKMRAVIQMHGSETKAPTVYLAVGRENLKGTSFFASCDPRPNTAQADLGATHAFEYGTLGVAASILGRDRLPRVTAWTALRPLPEVSIGAHFKFDPRDDNSGYVNDADFAINIRDADALIYDRPAYEITFLAKNRGESFHLSYFQHFVTRRLVRNPIEADHVTHITNYVDAGAEVSVQQERMKFAIGGSWQINKNNLIKGRLSQDNVQASYIIKTWANPAIVLGLNGGLNFKTGKPQYGFSLTCEAALGQPEFERAGSNYEEVQVVRYGAEAAPEVNRYDLINDDSPVLMHFPPPTTIVTPISGL